MFISSSGNVGVGTTTPPYKLTVQGTTLTDSSVSVQGAFNLNPLTAPTAIGGYTLSAGSSLGVGTYYYFAVYVTALGETSAGSTLTVITTAGNTTVNLTGIPVSSDPRVTARKIYRTKLNGTSDNEWFLTTISDNVTTTLTDNIADASLTGVGLQAYKVNTTSRYITTNGTQGMILDANLTALGLSAGATIISTNAAAVRSVFIGALAGENVTTGTANVLVGGAAGRNLTTGGSNTLIGDLAGFVISNASNNTAIGSQTARYLTTGGNNIIIGASSANVLTDGSTQFTQGTNNTILGNSIRMSTITDTNSIVIGNTAWSLGSNTTVLGNDSTTRTALRGNVSMGTTGSISSTLHIKGSGATSATTTLRVENINASASLVIRDDGSNLFVGSNGTSAGTWIDNTGSLSIIRSNLGTTYGLRVYNGAGWIGHNAIQAIAYQYPIYGAQGSNGAEFASPLSAGAGVYGQGGVGVYGKGITPSGDTGSIGVMATSLYVQPAGNTALYNRSASAHIIGTSILSGSVTITGSLIAPSITGSLQGTASYATQALSASWAPSVASNPFPFTGSAIISGSLTVTGSINGSVFNFISSSLTQSRVLLDSNAFTDLNISGLTPDVRARSPLLRIYGTYTTGSANTTGQNHILVAHLYPTFNPTNNSTSVFNTLTLEPQFLNINATGSARGLFITPGFVGSHPNWRSVEWDNTEGYGLYGAGTARNYLNGALGIGTLTPSASLHVTGSGIFSGSLAIGTSSLGPSENTLTLGARDAGSEGGQVGFNAPGGTYTSASFIDLYQNRLRILKGTNATSTGEVANWDMHSLQMALPAYNGPTVFTGTPVAGLGVDSNGNVVTSTRTGRYGTALSGSTIGTGVTAQTIVYSQLIPANTLVAGDVVRTYFRFRKLSTNANATYNILVNTSAAVAGATTLATLTANTVHNQMKRDFYIAQGNATTTVGAAINIAIDDTTNTQLLSVINWAADQYIIYTVTLNTADSGYGLGYTIEQVL